MQNGPTDLQEKVAEFITSLQYEQLPESIVNDAKYRVLDWLGCALAGIDTKPSHIMTQLVKDNGGAEQATLLRAGVKVPIGQAVLANGLTGHVVEFDDGHRLAISHPGAIAVPTALAVAEYLGRTGKELLMAVVIGYELLIRLGMAINPSHYKMWHSTSTCGVFAAAATASSLFQLDKDKTQMALGIAGTMAAGLQETFGTYAKPLNIGHACHSGVQAVLLAKNDFTGPTDIIMGKKGFIVATSEEYDVTPITKINDHHFISDTAFYKMYSSCGHTHSPLDAIFMMMDEHELSVQEITHIQIETYQTAVDLTGELKHNNADAAKFSLPYCIAVAIICKTVTLAEFTADKLQDPLIIALAKKVKVVEKQEATQAFPKRLADVKVELKNGLVFATSVTAADDTPRYDAIEEKFLSLAGTEVGYEKARNIKDIVLNLEKIVDIEELTKYLN